GAHHLLRPNRGADPVEPELREDAQREADRRKLDVRDRLATVRGQLRGIDHLSDEVEDERQRDEPERIREEREPVAQRDEEVTADERRQLPQLGEQDGAPGPRRDGNRAHASGLPVRATKASSISERSCRHARTSKRASTSAPSASPSTASSRRASRKCSDSAATLSTDASDA